MSSVEQLLALVENFAQHDSWRCAWPDRYPQTEDCPCGLLSSLKAAGIDPEPWRVEVKEQ